MNAQLKQLLDVPPSTPPSPPRGSGTEWLAAAGFLLMVAIGTICVVLVLTRAIFGKGV